MKEIQHRSECPISFSLDYIGDKWILLILRDLIFTNKCSYGDFLTSDEKIATNILADRLKLLEANEFIKSEVSPEKKNKFIYSLTEKGIDLIPAIVELMIWGSKYNPPGAKEVIKKIKTDKEGTIRQLREKLLAKVKSNADSMQ
ncbi:winged helix-turn-helix transcriptional regulator [Mucilaginibacter sp. KACC 22063]|uniref:winged helix-turn-helix transcriptional regulator n=1 Tax=Mucilaginibacter sp. KACC 22063 TaxID=3025666 RepID=UPI0023652482|nr:helix-turn-helix domain-containing protein [Mucilaginibacter sp. KACC 22063]WDF57268.1 helix-turn-helix domain-containing protein [Mucilaginibacter sp. KACC 22063]